TKGEKHTRQTHRTHNRRRRAKNHPATTTRQQLRRELHPPPIRVKTEAHRQSPENAYWLAVDLSNMRSLLHVYKMEHHHQSSHPSRTQPPLGSRTCSNSPLNKSKPSQKHAGNSKSCV